MPSHFTYEPRSLEQDLTQGDVLDVTEGLREVLRLAFQHFDDPHKYTRFAVLTQTCDLVRRSQRGGQACKAGYISLAAMRPLTVVLDREVSKFQSDSVERDYGLCRLEYQSRIERFVERLLNNNADGYFYFHDTGDAAIPEPMCAILPVSIALRAEHYDTCCASRVIGLQPVFQAKLGWLLGNNYSRVATQDWVPQGGVNARQFGRMVTAIARKNYAWPDAITMAELKAAISSSELAPDPVAITEFLNRTPSSRTDRMLDLIRTELRGEPELSQAPARIEAVVRRISRAPAFERLMRQQDDGA